MSTVVEPAVDELLLLDFNEPVLCDFEGCAREAQWRLICSCGNGIELSCTECWEEARKVFLCFIRFTGDSSCGHIVLAQFCKAQPLPPR